MIAGRKFILDLLFIKYSVLRWEINMKQGVGWGRAGSTGQGPCRAGGGFATAPKASWGQRAHQAGRLCQGIPGTESASGGEGCVAEHNSTGFRIYQLLAHSISTYSVSSLTAPCGLEDTTGSPPSLDLHALT